MKVNKKELVTTLEGVLPGLSTRDIVDQGKCFVFKDKKVITYNDEVAVFHPIDFELEGAVKAEEFFSILKQFRTKEVDIVVEEGEILIKNNKAHAGVPLTTDIRLPFDSLEIPKDWIPLQKDFIQILNFTSFCCGKSLTNELYRYILVENDMVMARDEMKSIRYWLVNEEMPRFFIYGKHVAILAEMDPIAIHINKGWIFFKNEQEVIIAVRTISDKEELGVSDDDFDITGSIVELPAEMKEAVEGARVFTKENKNDEYITITAKEGILQIKGEGDNGWFKRRFRIENKENFSFCVESEVILDALKIEAGVIVGERAIKIETDDYQYMACMRIDDEGGLE